MVFYLSEELVRRGHKVTLFASGDSETSAELVSVCKEALRLSQQPHDPLALHFAMVSQVLDRADDFDVVPFHTDYLHIPFLRERKELQLTAMLIRIG